MLTSGAEQNIRLTWFTVLFGRETKILASYNLDANILASPGRNTKIFASVLA